MNKTNKNDIVGTNGKFECGQDIRFLKTVYFVSVIIVVVMQKSFGGMHDEVQLDRKIG